MPDKRYITKEEVDTAVKDLAVRIRSAMRDKEILKVFGIPRGGYPIAQALQHVYLQEPSVYFFPTNDPEAADVIVDDLIDSGETRRRYINTYSKNVFFAFSKDPSYPGFELDRDTWVVFPWEAEDPTRATDVDASDHDIVTRLLQRIGEDPKRGGLLETPARFMRAIDTWFGGYDQSAEEILKTFEDGAEGVGELVIETDIPVYSFCEHHLAPIFGVAHVGYIPNGKVVGLSKIVRLVDMFARRLQVQERLTRQIAETFEKHVAAEAVGVTLQCRHLCMESRGVCSHGVVTTTSALRGKLIDEPELRAEFFSLVNMSRNNDPAIL